jgi:hypothetical protein
MTVLARTSNNLPDTVSTKIWDCAKLFHDNKWRVEVTYPRKTGVKMAINSESNFLPEKG